MRPEVERFAEVGDLAQRAAEIFEDRLRAAASERGAVSLALSRPTPVDAFKRIAAVRLPDATTVFQVDERKAGRGSVDRNLTLIERDLNGWVNSADVEPMPVEDAALDDATTRYAKRLTDICGTPPAIDLVHLGVGPDGHTASLLPGDPVLDVDDRWVAVTKPHGRFRRMTLTYPAINAAKLVVFIVAGEHKADALARVLRGDPAMPAARIEASNVVVLADRDAASGL